ncbi:MAG TPA: TOBE domain-containing protein [Actinomycetota bacterium]|nr:TOBE domain-containing protein [Actinomycetota bacterium]
MFDERPATVTDLRPLAIHGMPYVDVVARTDDGATLSARLGPEAVPEGLAVGDPVIAVTVMSNVIEIRRPSPG